MDGRWILSGRSRGRTNYKFGLGVVLTGRCVPRIPYFLSDPLVS